MCIRDRVNLTEGNSEFLANLTLAILPQSNEANFETQPIGTGPFKFVSFTPGQSLVVEAYEGYWNPELPYLDKVTFKIVADTDTAVTAVSYTHLGHWYGGRISCGCCIFNGEERAGTENGYSPYV